MRQLAIVFGIVTVLFILVPKTYTVKETKPDYELICMALNYDLEMYDLAPALNTKWLAICQKSLRKNL